MRKPQKLHKFFIEIPAGKYENRRLVSLLATEGYSKEEDVLGGIFDNVVLYFHGFPDTAVHPIKDEFASRMPKKLAEAFATNVENDHIIEKNAFMTFNFSGIPGSDDEISFDSKKLSREVEEAIFVCDYIKKKLLKHSNDEHSEHQTRVVGRLHVVGLSTGAIIGGLIRSQLELNDTLTLIAGLLDLKRGLSYDFDEKQLKSFEEKGECLKEFWLCDQECPVPQRVQVIRTKDTEKTGKIYLPLAKAYRDEYLNGSLNIKDSVSGMQNTSKELCPLLVIHGDQDVFVPFENGQELFEASKIPKTFLHIPKANHLLTNSKHLARAIKEMSSHMKKGKKE